MMAVPNFGSPKNYGDWAQYAGFDSSKPMMGIAPPLTNQAVQPQPVAPTIVQVGQRMQDVGTQFSQGNFMNAAKTFINGAAVPGAKPAVTIAPIPQNQPKDLDGDGMISDFEE
jgi:hypothetical protein